MPVAPSRRHAAFTLVELLVVIGIIAVLVSMLMPVISRAMNQAKFVSCRSNLQQVALAMRMYANDNRDHFPDPTALGDVHATPATFRRGVEWPDEADPTIKETLGLPNLFYQRGYIKSKNLWICPANDYYAKYGNTYSMVWSATFAGYTSQLRQRKAGEITFLMDNVQFGPFTTNKGKHEGAVSSGNLSTNAAIYPHAYRGKLVTTGGVAGRQGAQNVLYGDGVVGIMVWYYKNGSAKSEKIKGE